MRVVRSSMLFPLILTACGVEIIVQQTNPPTPPKVATLEGEESPSEGGDGTPTDTLPPDVVDVPPPPSPATISQVTATVLPETSRKALILNAIRAATTSLHAGLYLLTDTSITTALTDAYARSVDVQIVIDDSFQTSAQNKKNVATLTNAGVPLLKSKAFTFHHAKYMIIDGKEATIMTCNFTDSSFSSNREVVAKVKDKDAIAALEAIFQADMAGAATTVGLDSLLVVSPDNTREKLNGLIGNAADEIFVAVQAVDDNPFVYMLIGMKMKGVKVRVLIADPADKKGDAGDAQWLKSKGVEVRYLPTPYLHEKVILADDKVFVGSVNLTQTSITKNREIGFVGDAAFTATMKTQLEADWSSAVVF